MRIGCEMCVNDIFEIYDFIQNNKVDDVSDLVVYALSPSSEIKLNWLDCLSDDRLVDLFSCLIKNKKHVYNVGLIKKYYEQFIVNCI